ncbi:MAG: hypothetical protein PHU14_09270 [Methylovulum sp.]|nr:hypothetical protein [Methylovulum sp.]
MVVFFRGDRVFRDVVNILGVDTMKFKGRILLPLHIIFLRLLSFPLYQFARALASVAVFIGYGAADAKQKWIDMN